MRALPENAMQAGWLALPEGQVFACWHRPLGRPRECAVLMCDPFGSDRMNLHLSYRMLALELSRLGFGVLRVDLPGTCDSSGTARQPSARKGQSPLEAWFATLSAAADWLREEAHVTQLCAFGATLGGTLATALASRRDDVTGLLLWGPLPNGRAHLREMAAFRAMTKANPKKRLPSDHQQGDLEAMGFLITAELERDLTALDPAKLPVGNVKRAAVFRRNPDFPVEPVVQRLRKGGVEVMLQSTALVDLATLQDERACPPKALLDEMVGWCDHAWPGTVSATRQAAPTTLATEVVLATGRGQRVRERIVHFGGDRKLFGILTEPEAAAPDVGVVLVNGGSNHRVGINRAYVAWARDLAPSGVRTLRIDVRGLGDSPPPEGEAPCVLYRDSAQADVRSALDWLHRHGVKRTYCIGLCAGGYHALHTAIADPRVRGLVMLNPLRLKKAESAAVKAESERDFGSLASYGRKLLSPRAIARVLSGKVNVRGIAHSVGSRLSARVASRLARLRSSGAPGASWFSDVLLGLTGRGTDVLLVLDDADAITERILEDLGPDRARLDATGRLTTLRIADTDHIFTPLWSQEHVAQLVHATVLRWRDAAT